MFESCYRITASTGREVETLFWCCVAILCAFSPYIMTYKKPHCYHWQLGQAVASLQWPYKDLELINNRCGREWMSILIKLHQLFSGNANVSPFNLFMHYVHLREQMVICHCLLRNLGILHPYLKYLHVYYGLMDKKENIPESSKSSCQLLKSF